MYIRPLTNEKGYYCTLTGYCTAMSAMAYHIYVLLVHAKDIFGIFHLRILTFST